MSLNSTESVVDFMKSAKDSFRIVGSGNWLNGGRPVDANGTLNTSALSGIVEYIPGDLTMTVRAGSTLAELDDTAAREGQWMGINPVGATSGTIGATVATASSGSLSHGIGRMRDIVLGMEVVTGTGDVVRSGGKVVKNVAGFDLTRLQVGAWGTLGVITEISLRLRARPEVDETLCIALDPRKRLEGHLVALREIPLAALALELIAPSLAKRLELGETHALLVRLGGNETLVRAQRDALSKLGAITMVDSAVWSALRSVENTEHAVARVSHLPSQLESSWIHTYNEVFSATHSPCLMHATVSRGQIRIAIPNSPTLSPDEHRGALSKITSSIAPPGGHVVWEQLPPGVWNTVPSAVADSLSVGLKRAFDPNNFCNPGILGASTGAPATR